MSIHTTLSPFLAGILLIATLTACSPTILAPAETLTLPPAAPSKQATVSSEPSDSTTLNSGRPIPTIPGKSTPTPTEPAPRKQQLAFIQDDNVYLGTIDGAPPLQITFDGNYKQVPNGSTIPRITYVDGTGDIQWSPDGRYLTFVRLSAVILQGYTRELILYDTTTGTTRTLLNEELRGYDWAADSRHIVFGREITWADVQTTNKLYGEPIYGIWIMNVETGQMEEYVPPPDEFPLGYPRFDADYTHLFMRHIVYLEGTMPLAIYDTSAGEFIHMDGLEASEWSGIFDLSPLNDQMAYDENVYGIAGGNTIHLSDNYKRDPLSLIPPDPSFFCVTPSFSPDGKKIVFLRGSIISNSYEETGPLFMYLYNMDSKQADQLSDFSLEDNTYTWDPDGSHIVYQEQHNSCPKTLNITSGAIADFPYCGSLPVFGP